MKQIILFITLAISGAVMAQPTYTISNYGSPGYGFLQSEMRTGFTAFDFTITGANQTWNYAGLVQEANNLKEVIDPNNTDYRLPWITKCALTGGNPISCNNDWSNLTDLAQLIVDSINTVILSVYDLTSLLEVDGGYVIANIQGAKVADTSNTIVPITSNFTDRDTVYAFPLNFGNTHASHGKWEVDLNSIGRNIRLVVDYDRTYTVDGWGTLITPYKAHSNVLKIRTVVDEIDSLYLNGIPFGYPRKIVQYTWFDPAYGLPVMEVSGTISGTTENYELVTFLDSNTSNIKEDNLIQFELFPIPTQDELTINIPENIAYTRVEILDIRGKLLQSDLGTNLQKINVSTLAPGTYLIGIFNQDKPIGFKQFIKE